MNAAKTTTMMGRESSLVIDELVDGVSYQCYRCADGGAVLRTFDVEAEAVVALVFWDDADRAEVLMNAEISIARRIAA